MLKFFRRLQGHKDIWEGEGVAPPIHVCTCQPKWLTSLPARSLQTQRQTGNFRFQSPVVYFLSLSCCVNRQTQQFVLIVHYICSVVFVG
jgi:hypothetical protein